MNGVPSDWEGPLYSQFNGAEAPFAIQQLNAVATTLVGLPRLQRIDTSGMGPGNDGDGKIPDSIFNLIPDPNEICDIDLLIHKNIETV